MPRTIGLLNVFMNILSSSTVWSPHPSTAHSESKRRAPMPEPSAVLCWSSARCWQMEKLSLRFSGSTKNGPFWDVHFAKKHVWCKKTTPDLRKMNVDTHPLRGSCRAIPKKTDGWEQDLPPKLGIFGWWIAIVVPPEDCHGGGSNFQAKEVQMWTPQSWKGFVTIRDCHWWMMAIYLSWVKHLQCL